MEKGIVFNIQRFSVHDGPGIRTTVFLKGCPLSCLWCHNPESQSFQREITIRRDRCAGCRACMRNCPNNAISFEDGNWTVDNKACARCGQCIKVCPNNALEMVGYDMTTDDVMREVEKDLLFYEESNGGVTFSGGEPIGQVNFLKELLIRCKNNGIHTTVDTSGYTSWETLEEISENVDLFLFDIKHIDDIMHREYIGVSNKVILDNLKKLAQMGKAIYVRIPIIPTINDDLDTIKKVCNLLSTITIKQVNILPYHDIARDKYSRLGKTYKLDDIKPPSREEMLRLKEIISGFGLKTKIGG